MIYPAALRSLNNGGPHGLSEVVYAFTSAAANNGSAFAGLNANTDWYNYALAFNMFVGRFAVIVPVLAIAGSLAAKKTSPPSSGTFPDERSALHHPPPQRRPDRRRAHLFPGPFPRPDRRAIPHAGRPHLLTHELANSDLPFSILPSFGRPSGRPFKKLDPRVQWRSPVMFVVLLGALWTSVITDCPLQRLQLSDHALALVHPSLRQFRRSDGGRPRQGAGRRAAPDAHHDHGAPPDEQSRDRRFPPAT